MSYDLAVWDGPRPTSPEAATAEYERRMDAMEASFESDDGPEPAAPSIAAFVEAAMARYPDHEDGYEDDSGVECPWASLPLIGEAVGDLIYFPMTFSGAEYARDVLAELATSMGLVCYDPQVEALLPDPTATPASEIGARAYAALEAHLRTESAASAKQGWLTKLLGRKN